MQSLSLETNPLFQYPAETVLAPSAWIFGYQSQLPTFWIQVPEQVLAEFEELLLDVVIEGQGASVHYTHVHALKIH